MILKEFIRKGIYVNGIPMGVSHENMHNGAGCFALNLVREYKEETGNLYATYEDDDQSYNYEIRFKALEGRCFAIEISSDNDEGDFNETFTTDEKGRVLSLEEVKG